MFEKTVQRLRRRTGTFALCALLSVSAANPSWANNSADSAVAEELSVPAEVIVRALTLMGITYRWGGNLPETGMDCSGFVRHVFHEAAGLVLPRKSEEMSRAATSIGKEHLLPGDLVFFNTQRRGFSHVGIYLGEDKFVHAPAKGKSIRIDSMDDRYWVRRFDGARRVMGELPHHDPAALDQLIDRTLAKIGVPLNDFDRSAGATPIGKAANAPTASLLTGGQWRLHANAAQTYLDAQRNSMTQTQPGTDRSSAVSTDPAGTMPSLPMHASTAKPLAAKTQLASFKPRQVSVGKRQAANDKLKSKPRTTASKTREAKTPLRRSGRRA